MWEIAVLLLLGGPAVWVGTLRLRSQAERLLTWRRVAAASGLKVVGSTSVWSWRLRLAAQTDSIQVRIENALRGNLGTRIAVVVPGPPGFGSVRIRREVGEPGAREIEIGDKAFDRTFSIEGPMRLVCVLLDVKARRLLRQVSLKSWVEIAGGELRAETFDDKIADLLRLLLDLGRRFAQKSDVVQCLVENAQRDPRAGVRLNNLLLLVRECAWSPRTDEALRTACSDRSPQVRLRAAIALGAEGRGVLQELAESRNDDRSAQALRIIGRELPFERIADILDRALYGRRIQTARACLEALGLSGTAEAVETLAEVLAQEKVELATIAAQALGTTGNAAAEAPLIRALQREQPDLRMAAAQALGRVGSVTAVLPLKEAARRSWLDLDLHGVTRQAIAEIQSRLPGASPGQLSLAGAEVGQLSLAQAEAGQLSLAGDAAGQLSLSDDQEGSR